MESKKQVSSALLSPPESSFAYVDSEVLLLSATSSTEGFHSQEELFETSGISTAGVFSNVTSTGLYNSETIVENTSISQNDLSVDSFHAKPPQSHWFYSKKVEKKKVWLPFSLLDSLHLEEKFIEGNNEQSIIATDGGRYDVYLMDRVRRSIYWEEESTAVRRATWFYRREGERLFIPYPEHFAEKLEEEYCIAVHTNTWHRRLEFPQGETVVFHNPDVIVHYQISSVDKWEGSPEGPVKPSVVKRGMDDYDQVDDGEPTQIDHLVFVVHGIGAICDLKFRTLPEVVNDFRSISGTLLKTHFQSKVDEDKIGRVEFLPASWHTFLHGEATGIDEKLKPITLKSIPKLRYFANDAILDVLFYTSPFYCQAIINQVGSEINRLYNLFIVRNPTFQGEVSLAGHSLGSVILFDILLHQEDSPAEQENKNLTIQATKHGTPKWSSADTKIDLTTQSEMPMKDTAVLKEVRENKRVNEISDKLTDIPKIASTSESITGRRRKQSETTINYIVGLAGTGHPFVIYPRLNFKPTCFFALGSPIAMFLTVRGLDTDWKDFQFPSCPAFFNIFHPYDPVAYRIEPLIDPSINLKPVLIPHHKGRKRMHLEIKESLTRVGNDLKQKVYDSLLYSWNTINDFARIHRNSAVNGNTDINTPGEEELNAQKEDVDVDAGSTIGTAEYQDDEVAIGNLNKGRRIDYVLQEKPLESFNEYLFALGSHTCYWESEDTVLLILKEIYASYGITPTFQFAELAGKRGTT